MNRIKNIEDHWCVREFKDIDFGDRRLNSRFQITAKKIADLPSASINHACNSWPEAKGAYRLFNNKKVTTRQILDTHRRRVCERIRESNRILIIQDTSFLNYTEHFKTVGLGPIGCVNKKKTKADSKGLVVHTALALNESGLPIGILAQDMWSREPKEKRPAWKKKAGRKRISIENKESNKWLRSISGAHEWIPKGVQAVTIADRESDLYEFISRAEFIHTHYLIRSCWDRAIQVDHEAYYLWDYLAIVDNAGTYEIEVELPRVAKQKVAPKRTAKLEIRFSAVELRRNPKKKVDRSECPPFLPTYAVWAKEIDPPKDVAPLEWMLLTNVPVKSFADAKERIDWYKLRWHIENFHKVLKSGLNVELCRLQTAERLEKYVTLCSVIAWYLYWLTHINRVEPESECTRILEDHEWKSLYCKINNTRTLPGRCPTTREAIRWIAKLGGFLGRKSDGEPGIICLWRGYQRLMDISESWKFFFNYAHKRKSCG